MTQLRPKIDRRDFLKLMGTFAATSVVATACAPEISSRSRPDAGFSCCRQSNGSSASTHPAAGAVGHHRFEPHGIWATSG